jgi:hypothetical protein
MVIEPCFRPLKTTASGRHQAMERREDPLPREVACGAEEDERVSSFDQGLRNRIHGTPTTRKTPKKITPRMRPYVQKSLPAM